MRQAVAVETGNRTADPPTPPPAPQLALAQSEAITTRCPGNVAAGVVPTLGEAEPILPALGSARGFSLLGAGFLVSAPPAEKRDPNRENHVLAPDNEGRGHAWRSD